MVTQTQRNRIKQSAREMTIPEKLEALLGLKRLIVQVRTPDVIQQRGFHGLKPKKVDEVADAAAEMALLVSTITKVDELPSEVAGQVALITRFCSMVRTKLTVYYQQIPA